MGFKSGDGIVNPFMVDAKFPLSKIETVLEEIPECDNKLRSWLGIIGYIFI